MPKCMIPAMNTITLTAGVPVSLPAPVNATRLLRHVSGNRAYLDSGASIGDGEALEGLTGPLTVFPGVAGETVLEYEDVIAASVTTGKAGPAGPKGDRGARGPRGERGPLGQTGDVGSPGSKGDRGPDGREGPRGPGGDRGPRGMPGPKGDQGIRSSPGPAEPRYRELRGEEMLIDASGCVLEAMKASRLRLPLGIHPPGSWFVIVGQVQLVTEPGVTVQGSVPGLLVKTSGETWQVV